MERISRGLVFGMVIVLAVAFSACGGPTTAGGGAGNPLPTTRPAEDVGGAASSAAKDNYQATWDSYLRDSIAAANDQQRVKLSMLQRYEKPSITAQNTGGLMKQVDLVEDRTTFNLINEQTTASAVADFDIKITFVNGDTDTRKCSVQVGIELNPDDKLWYVLNPSALNWDSVCRAK
jgi:hypothetical protein